MNINLYISLPINTEEFVKNCYHDNFDIEKLKLLVKIISNASENLEELIFNIIKDFVKNKPGFIESIKSENIDPECLDIFLKYINSKDDDKINFDKDQMTKMILEFIRRLVIPVLNDFNSDFFSLISKKDFELAFKKITHKYLMNESIKPCKNTEFIEKMLNNIVVKIMNTF